MAKSHQLPYPKSHSTFDAPLDLIFLDVWGLAPMSGFIDDFSKYTWI
jgi:hypothetical protein